MQLYWLKRLLTHHIEQGTPVSERAVPVAIFETEPGLIYAVLSCSFFFLILYQQKISA